MKHRHHIIPRHMNGSDDPSNIQELTIEEHAEAHRILYEKYGCEEDRIAWLGLSHQLEAQEIIQQVLRLAGHKGKKALEKWHAKCRGSSYDEIYGKQKAQELKEIRRKRVSGNKNPMYGAKHTDEWREEHSARMSGENHFNYGKPAFNRGRVWVNDGNKSRMVNKHELPELLSQGWIRGRLP